MIYIYIYIYLSLFRHYGSKDIQVHNNKKSTVQRKTMITENKFNQKDKKVYTA